MDPEDVALLVVGGGPAAHHAAVAYRDHGGAGRVLLVSDDEVPPYFRPPLSKDFLRGESGDDDLWLGDPDGIEVRTGTAVTALSVGDRRARLSDGGEVRYRRLVLATGAGPATLDVPGADGPGVAYLRTLGDARALRHRAGAGRRAVVVGSGFIGCEAAVSLARRGVDVTLCGSERVPQAARLGDAVGERIARWLRQEKVVVRGSTRVVGVEHAGGGPIVHVGQGGPVVADLVVAAVGITPRTGLAIAAGLPVDSDRIVVDERMRTAVDGVFAAGDATIARNASAGRPLAVEHWGEAEAMGAIAGTNAAGGDAMWSDPPGFWTEVGDRTLKYAAWGDGFDEVRVESHSGGGLTAWYGRDGVLVGIATHQADDDYERGVALVRDGARVTAVDAPGHGHGGPGDARPEKGRTTS